MNLQKVIDAVAVLGDEAKTYIKKKLELGAMLEISLDWFPNKLVVDLMESCELTSECIQLVVGPHKIPITPQVVNDILGLPLGEDDTNHTNWLDNVQQKKDMVKYFGISKIKGNEDVSVSAMDIIKQITGKDYLMQTRGFCAVLWNKLICPDTSPYIRGSDFIITNDMEHFAMKNWCKHVCDRLLDSIQL
jgi:hypothetical protein